MYFWLALGKAKDSSHCLHLILFSNAAGGFSIQCSICCMKKEWSSFIIIVFPPHTTKPPLIWIKLSKLDSRYLLIKQRKLNFNWPFSQSYKLKHWKYLTRSFTLSYRTHLSHLYFCCHELTKCLKFERDYEKMSFLSLVNKFGGLKLATELTSQLARYLCS